MCMPFLQSNQPIRDFVILGVLPFIILSVGIDLHVKETFIIYTPISIFESLIQKNTTHEPAMTKGIW